MIETLTPVRPETAEPVPFTERLRRRVGAMSDRELAEIEADIGFYEQTGMLTRRLERLLMPE